MTDPDNIEVHVIEVKIAVECSDHHSEQLEALVEERVTALVEEIKKRFGNG